MIPKLTTIDDPIAVDQWTYKRKGIENVSTIEVGRPALIPGDPMANWYCPIRIEGFAPGVLCLGGVGPVDALVNALEMLKHFGDSVDDLKPREGQP